MFTSVLVIFHHYFESDSWGRTDQDGKVKLAFVEEFFHNVVAKKLINNKSMRRIIFGTTVPLMILFFAFAVQLQSASKALSFWKEDHPLAFYFVDSDDAYQSNPGENSQQLSLTWGLKPDFIDRSGTDETDALDRGETIFYDQSEFDVSDPKSQQYLRSICYTIAQDLANELYISNVTIAADEISEVETTESIPANCFMAAFALWREARNEPFPVPKPQSEREATDEFDFTKLEAAKGETFEESMQEFLRRPDYAKRFIPQLTWDFGRGNDGKRLLVKSCYQSFDTLTLKNHTRGERLEIYNAWYDMINQEEGMDSYPKQLQSMQVTDVIYFVWMVTQELFTTNAFISLGLSLLLAFIISTMATNNVIVACLATLSICGITVQVAGIMSMAGWELGSVESVCVTILVGFSVDYILHIAVAYSELDEDGKLNKTNEEKVSHALTTMGVSILFGAMSTIGASSFLLVATITFFTKFGTFMLMACFSALSFGLLVFPSLLVTFGPTNGRGSVKHLTEKLLCQSGKKEKRSEEMTNVVALGYFGVLIILAALVFALSLMEKNSIAAASKAPKEVIDTSKVIMTPLSEMKNQEWNILQPGGETICSRGTDYAFMVRKGSDPSSVIIEFEGGGACWDLDSCRTSTQIFKDTVTAPRSLFGRIREGIVRPSGLKDPEGPYINYTHIYIPYCTGDLHWGNNVMDYTEDLQIQHKGSVNVRAVLDWVFENVPVPEKILSTGCSAGAYGSVLWSAHIAKHYESLGADTVILQMGDAGLGAISEDFMLESFPAWNVFSDEGSFPMFVLPSNETIDLASLSLPKLYRWVAETFPQHTFSQFSSAYDLIQAFFLTAQIQGYSTPATGEDAINWNVEFRELYDLPTMPSNYKHIIGNGDYHCNIISDRHWWVLDGDGKPFYMSLYKAFVLGEALESSDCLDIGEEQCLLGSDVRSGVVFS